MQVVRKTGSWFLWSWARSPTPGVVPGAPASTIRTGARQLQDAAAKQEVEEKAAAPAPSRSSFRSSAGCEETESRRRLKETKEGIRHHPGEWKKDN
ncbi:28S ribosomal protein S11, mitochondrial-like [Leopardus geoffroyi]|uniref:28S ribosomal protein S11, mitochondrial-like n=1 Tax=Leopardus geoffroyi TaxID=46844 RepID=UPI001E261CB3|nr:28S ribosomal protein S11, mitochondrial-like [Leopardus geoffroyi]